MAKGNFQLHDVNHAFTRAGEGTLVPATFTHDVGANGITTLSMSVNLSEAPVPDRRYVADFVSVVYNEDMIKMVFGQEKLGSTDARSCVVIATNTRDVAVFLQTLARLKNPTLDEIAEQAGVTKIAEIRQIDQEPAQTIALSANFVLTAASSRSSCLDFYSISAFAFASAPKSASKKIPVEPVVRIDLSTANLIALREELIRVVPAMDIEAIGGLS